MKYLKTLILSNSLVMRRFYLVLIIFVFSCLQLHGRIITNPERLDGFGCQFYFIIAAATYAELNNHTFKYKKFKFMDHNYANDPDYLLKKENLINFIGNFELAQAYSCPHEVAEFSYLASNINSCVNTEVFKKIKRIFRENKNREDFFDKNKFNIAITVRNPNKNDVPSFISSYSKLKDLIYTTYLTIIGQLREIYSSYPIEFHFYSVGDEEEFRKIFSAPDIVFHINDSIENTFTSLVLADVLVTFPRSGFSYTAGLLSEGIVYNFEAGVFRHPSLPNWIKLDDGLRQGWTHEYEAW